MKHRIVTLILLSIVIASCNHNASQGDIDVDLIQNPNSASGYDASAPMPVMAFDCDLHDFGRISQGESISYSFHFVNKGQRDLVVSGCSATCGCTVADYPRGRIAPGGEGYITVTFNSQGKIGQQYQEVTVSSNAQPSKNVLKIVAQVAN
ncbi:MAG: DUF1573 domain-containing protein [Bacteroidales bacterium]|nr:DUF1573 domain-containing protein [Bacteroidales bacterium]